jgi:hypothetical protein
MKRALTNFKLFVLGFATLLFVACNTELSLQQYYVEKSEDPNFLSVDIPANVLGLNMAELSEENKKTFDSFRKLNMLLFKYSVENESVFTKEKAVLKNIFSQQKFNTLMTLSDKDLNAKIMYIGDDDAIDEVVVYGDIKNIGFGVVRILGNDMNPEQLASFASQLNSSDFDIKQLKESFSFLL